MTSTPITRVTEPSAVRRRAVPAQVAETPVTRTTSATAHPLPGRRRRRRAPTSFPGSLPTARVRDSPGSRGPATGPPSADGGLLPWTRSYFLLRRWWRVLRRSLRCFFFAMRLRRFLMTEPIVVLACVWCRVAGRGNELRTTPNSGSLYRPWARHPNRGSNPGSRASFSVHRDNGARTTEEQRSTRAGTRWRWGCACSPEPWGRPVALATQGVSAGVALPGVGDAVSGSPRPSTRGAWRARWCGRCQGRRGPLVSASGPGARAAGRAFRHAADAARQRLHARTQRRGGRHRPCLGSRGRRRLRAHGRPGGHPCRRPRPHASGHRHPRRQPRADRRRRPGGPRRAPQRRRLVGGPGPVVCR